MAGQERFAVLPNEQPTLERYIRERARAVGASPHEPAFRASAGHRDHPARQRLHGRDRADAGDRDRDPGRLGRNRLAARGGVRARAVAPHRAHGVQGHERRSARRIAEDIENVGGEINAATSVEYTSYTARVLGEDVDVALDVIGDILTASPSRPPSSPARRA